MHGIIAMASDLKEMALSEKACEAISIISDCADHLLSLVNDVLDFARFVPDSFHDKAGEAESDADSLPFIISFPLMTVSSKANLN